MTTPPPPAEPGRPRALLATSALLLVLAPAALARDAPWFAAWMLLAALIPLRPRHRLAGVLLAYAGAGYCLFSVLRVPFGARVGVFVIAGLALGARVWALRGEAARRWASPGDQ
jgi:hypothetical protein